MYPFVAILIHLFFTGTLWAQPNCVEAEACQSQLFRFEVSESVLGTAGDNLLPLLQQAASSESIRTLIQEPRSIAPVAIPPKKDVCEREKSFGNPLYAQIDCSNSRLCEETSVSTEVRAQLCFHLPCPLFEGTLLPGRCGSVTNVHATNVTFPEKLRITESRLTPTSVQFRAPEARLCFRIDALSLSSSVQLNLETSGTNLPDRGIRLDNVSPSLDGPRDVCVKANLDLRAERPVSNLTIETSGDAPFISDRMIREASERVTISGLSGYPAADIASIRREVLPPLLVPLRNSLETSLKSALAGVFETELNRLTRGPQGSRSHQMSTQSLMSEVGLGNLRFRESLSRVQCRALAAAEREIPGNHPCRSIKMFGDQIGSSLFRVGLLNELKAMKREGDLLNVTSERIKQDLIELKEIMRAERSQNDDPSDTSSFAEESRRRYAEYVEQNIQAYVDPLIDRISQNQLQGQLVSFVEFQDLQQGRFGRNVGVNVPEICSDTQPSPHARRSIPNCGIQAYTDLNEMNRLLERMWREGNLCQAGKGPYVASEERYDERGIPNGTGCEFEVAGLRCFLNSPPAINWDARARRYQTRVSLKACHRRGVIMDIGRFGGDFNLDLSYVPEVAANGDFTLGRTSARLRVIPGSERFDLVPGSSLRTTILNTIERSASEALQNSIRIPFASGIEGLAGIPLRPEGRVDAGPGYFGACLEVAPQ